MGGKIFTLTVLFDVVFFAGKFIDTSNPLAPILVGITALLLSMGFFAIAES